MGLGGVGDSTCERMCGRCPDQTPRDDRPCRELQEVTQCRGLVHTNRKPRLKRQERLSRLPRQVATLGLLKTGPWVCWIWGTVPESRQHRPACSPGRECAGRGGPSQEADNTGLCAALAMSLHLSVSLGYDWAAGKGGITCLLVQKNPFHSFHLPSLTNGILNPFIWRQTESVCLWRII